jgi:RNA polymerase sigma factor (sigma-70 family)
MPDEDMNTLSLLERWQCGDSEALSLLLDRDLPWIRDYVHHQLGDGLRRVGDTDDFVQEAALAVLRYGPRFALSSRRQFRALLAKITLNVLRCKHRELHALKRDPRNERALGTDTILYLDPPRQDVTRPDQRVERQEEREWLRLALLLLDPQDQEPLDLHWQGLSDAEIGDSLGITANTARMRRVRATGRLTTAVLKLKRGQIADLVALDS